MNKTSKYSVFMSITVLMFFSSSAIPTAEAAGNQITLGELGVLQLGAHDLFNVDRGDRINANTATDFENGKLDLSTLFIDMTTGTPFSLSEIEMGGEPRNRENIILFSIASRIGQNYVQDFNNLGEQQAHQNALDAYHSMFNSAYMNAFGESAPQSRTGCATMTENLAFRTVHDFLPETIQKDGNSVPIFSLLPPFSDPGLTDAELLQSSSMLDGIFDDAFTQPLHIIIQLVPLIEINIPSLLQADTDFAFQFNTDFPFGIDPPGFLSELTSGSYASTEALNQIRNLIAKGYGHGCYIGGEIIPTETTALILAGAQSTAWMIPVILSTIGIGLFAVSRKSENF